MTHLHAMLKLKIIGAVPLQPQVFTSGV